MSATADLWSRIMTGVAAKVSADCLATWFLPVNVLRFEGRVLELEVPTEIFRAAFAEHYLDTLHQVAAEAAGAPIEIRLSTPLPEQPKADGCARENSAQPLPVVRASELETPVRQQSWLIERLWTYQAVGIIGGSPKSGKTWLALEMAVSVASGSSCLETFPVPKPGPVLLYAAEDSAAALRTRIETLARLHKVDFEQLDLHVITVDSLRLDHPDHQARLEATLQVYRPALLVIDPLVRVHAIDENVAGQIAALLGYLRFLQRNTGAAIALIHHIRKNVSHNGGAGYSLRGSGDLYAWLDSFLYLRMHQGQRTVSAEHRSAPSFGPIALELVQSESTGPHLRITSLNGNLTEKPSQDGLASRILELLSAESGPLTIETLRSRLQVRNERVVETLRSLEAQGKLLRGKNGITIKK
jgi:hypothetical protein